MRPLVVVAADEVVEAGLLLEDVLRGRSGGLDLQRPMHPLVPAVLLRMAGRDAFDLDPESQPPDRELAEVEQSLRAGEGNAVIGPDHRGQPELFEGAIEHAEGIALPGRLQRLAGQ